VAAVWNWDEVEHPASLGRNSDFFLSQPHELFGDRLKLTHYWAKGILDAFPLEAEAGPARSLGGKITNYVARLRSRIAVIRAIAPSGFREKAPPAHQCSSKV